MPWVTDVRIDHATARPFLLLEAPPLQAHGLYATVIRNECGVYSNQGLDMLAGEGRTLGTLLQPSLPSAGTDLAFRIAATRSAARTPRASS